MTRNPDAAAQSGDALIVVGGGAQNTAEARVTSAQAPVDTVVKQEGGSSTPAGVSVATHSLCCEGTTAGAPAVASACSACHCVCVATRLLAPGCRLSGAMRSANISMGHQPASGSGSPF